MSMACMVSRLGRLVLVLLPIVACAAPAAQSCGSSSTTPSTSSDRREPASGKSGLWPNEPAGMRVVSDVSLGAWKEGGWSCVGAGLFVATDSTMPSSPPSALVFPYPTGFGSGYAPGGAYYDVP